MGFCSKTLLRSAQALSFALILFSCGLAVHAQVTTGTVRGEVRDQTGAVVPGATVTITDPNTKTSKTVQSGTGGEYQFNSLPVGDFTMTVQPPASSNFAPLTLTDIRVQLNQVTDVTAILQPAGTSASVNVSAGGVELVDSTTLNLTRDFTSREVVDLPQSSQGAGI